MREVPLHGSKARGRVALVDDPDFELVMAYRWHVQEYTRNGSKAGPYALAYVPGPARVPQADRNCSVCGQRPAMARRACHRCYKRYWKAGLLDELAPAKPILGGARSVKMHTLITGWPYVDHQDRNGLNNTRQNLREATHAQNMANRLGVRGSTSQYKGVSLHSYGKWKAEICANGDRRYLGLFADEADAGRAYDAAAVAMQGAWAYVNFPDDWPEPDPF